MFAGLKNSTGDLVVIMDADLQHSPDVILEMIKYIEEGFDTVTTLRNRKGEKAIKSMFAKMFYSIMKDNKTIELKQGSQDFRMMTRQVVDSILSLNEYNRFSKGIFSWVGFNTKYIEVENRKRAAGKTKWSFWKLFLYSLEGIVAFSTMPLVLASLFGIIFLFIAFILIVIIIVKTLVFGDPTSGWPSLVCIILFVSGTQLFCMGIMGQYLSKTYLEVKKRPIYIVGETNIYE